MKRGITSIMTAALMLIACNASAATFFFSEKGAGDSDGSSWENAAPAEYLGSSVENATAGDVFYLMAGKYKPDVNSGLWKIAQGITIKGGYPSTMKGTDVNIKYPVAALSIFSADLDGDGVGDNGTNVFITIDNSTGTKETALKTIISGIEIRDALNKSTATYKGSAMVIYNGNVELDHVKITNNVTGYKDASNALVGAGGVISVCGSYFYAHDCVWENNQSTRAGSALIVREAGGASGTGATTDKDISIVKLDRCEFSDNPMIDPANTKATYGGTIAVGDYCGTMYMNNCTATGTHIYQAGAFCRMGTGTTLYSTNNTWYDCTCCATNRFNGSILSCGQYSKTYIANTIAVNKVDGYDGSFATMFIQSNNCVFETGGYNVWGSLSNATTTALLANDNVANTNTVSVVFGENVIASNGGNGTKVIAPSESYRGMSVSSLKELATKWSLPAEIDVTLDQRGFVRPENTISGAYDVQAVDPTTGVEQILDKAQNIKIINLGNANYQIIGAAGNATIYDLTGKSIMSRNIEDGDIINMNDIISGIYIIKVNNQAIKFIK